MKLSIGDKVSYHYPESSFPASKNNGKDYTGVVTDVKAEVTHDRATVDINTNQEHLTQIECNQAFIELS